MITNRQWNVVHAQQWQHTGIETIETSSRMIFNLIFIKPREVGKKPALGIIVSFNKLASQAEVEWAANYSRVSRLLEFLRLHQATEPCRLTAWQTEIMLKWWQYGDSLTSQSQHLFLLYCFNSLILCNDSLSFTRFKTNV